MKCSIIYNEIIFFQKNVEQNCKCSLPRSLAWGAGKWGSLGRFPPAAFLSFSAPFFLRGSERCSLPAGKVQFCPRRKCASEAHPDHSYICTPGGLLASSRAHGSLSMLPLFLLPTPESGSVALALFPFLTIAQEIRPIGNRQSPPLMEPPVFSLEGDAVLSSPPNLFCSALLWHTVLSLARCY